MWKIKNGSLKFDENVELDNEIGENPIVFPISYQTEKTYINHFNMTNGNSIIPNYSNNFEIKFQKIGQIGENGLNGVLVQSSKVLVGILLVQEYVRSSKMVKRLVLEIILTKIFVIQK